MPTITKKATRKGRRGAQAVRKAARAHLLIIECDSQRLVRQGMHLGTGFGHIVKTLFPNKRIAIVQTSTEKKMAEDLAKLYEDYGRFRTILIVGHSDAEELEMTADGSRPWATVGAWINKFEPESLFLAACEAGRSESVRTLFESVGKSLREIYACPVPLHKIHTAPMAVLIYMRLTQRSIDPQISQALRVVHYGLAGGQLFRWLRKETGPGRGLEGKLWDAIGKSFYLGEWDLLKKLEDLF
jgi:hypothetical protein